MRHEMTKAQRDALAKKLSGMRAYMINSLGMVPAARGDLLRGHAAHGKLSATLVNRKAARKGKSLTYTVR